MSISKMQIWPANDNHEPNFAPIGNANHAFGYRDIIEQQRHPRLRGYTPADRNAKLTPKTVAVSDDSIVAFLNSHNLIYCSVEIFSEKNMPTQELHIFPQNMSDFDMLINIMSSLKSIMVMGDIINRAITEIRVTPVYQTVEGFPKVFTDEDQSISVLATLNKKTDISEISLDQYM